MDAVARFSGIEQCLLSGVVVFRDASLQAAIVLPDGGSPRPGR